MSTLEEINTKLDGIHMAMSDLSGDIGSLVALVAQLKEQVAAGGVSEALVAEISAKVDGISAKIVEADSLVEGATGVVTP